MMYNSNQWIPMALNSSASWSREEDKVFEKGLVDYPDWVEDRWQRIADSLPGKSPEDVRVHYEALLYDVSEIDSGRIEPPSYSEGMDSSGWDDGQPSGNSGQISFGAGPSRTKHVDVERKKGTPWSTEEHRLFLVGLNTYGKGDWRSISRNVVVSRTPTQVASHAQKYFLRQTAVKKERKRSSIHDVTTTSDSVTVPAPTNLPNQVDFQNYSLPCHPKMES